MNQLYLVFFAFGVLLFGAIALYSYMQMGGLKHRRSKSKEPKIPEDNDDLISSKEMSKEAKLKDLKKTGQVGLNDDSDLSAPTNICLLYTSPSPRDATLSRMPSSA